MREAEQRKKIVRGIFGAYHSYDITCSECGHVNFFAIWAWDGNGYLKCKGCGVRIGRGANAVMGEWSRKRLRRGNHEKN